MPKRILLAVAALALASCGPDAARDSRAQATAGLGGWQTGGNVGYGVASLDTGNDLGENVFIGYAGYNINLGQAESWVGELYDARLRALGVRYLFAIQGPSDPGYNALEIGNSKIVAALGGIVKPTTGFIAVAGHSSGSFVADELLQQLDTGADPFGAYGGRLVYWDLDGDQKYVAASGINRLRKAYYVNAYDPASGVHSYNFNVMNSLGGAYAGKGGAVTYDAASSGCGAVFCVHISLINTVPHDPNNGSGIDYADFGGRPVNHWWLDAKVAEAGLGQCAGPFSTQGAIEFVYALAGGCASSLGPPTTNELPCADGIGRFNNFQNGAIYFSPATSVHTVVGKIYQRWQQLNYENGVLGYPISEAHAVGTAMQSDFQHGSIAILADGSVQVLLPGADAGSGPTPADAGTPAQVEDAGQPEPAPGPIDFAGQPPQLPVATHAVPVSEVTGGCSATGGAGGALYALAIALLRRKRPTANG